MEVFSFFFVEKDLMCLMVQNVTHLQEKIENIFVKNYHSSQPVALNSKKSKILMNCWEMGWHNRRANRSIPRAWHWVKVRVWVRVGDRVRVRVS